MGGMGGGLSSREYVAVVDGKLVRVRRAKLGQLQDVPRARGAPRGAVAVEGKVHRAARLTQLRTHRHRPLTNPKQIESRNVRVPAAVAV